MAREPVARPDSQGLIVERVSMYFAAVHRTVGALRKVNWFGM